LTSVIAKGRNNWKKKDKMRNFLNQQLKGKDVQLATLAKDHEMAIDW
jgi:hypothetical protein